ncbi:hypothetical protein ATCC90586_000642 [Pythium insidiosum]|nr:hypothetical protein ATCC90586_000642 [Pythium insidiosum]
MADARNQSGSLAPCPAAPPPPISLAMLLNERRNRVPSPHSEMVASGVALLRKSAPKPLFANFDEKAYCIRPPTQMMRLVDALRFHKPTEDERAQLNLCSSTERLSLHQLSDLLLVCGGRKGFRFASAEIQRLRQTSDDIALLLQVLKLSFRVDHSSMRVHDIVHAPDVTHGAHLYRVQHGVSMLSYPLLCGMIMPSSMEAPSIIIIISIIMDDRWSLASSADGAGDAAVQRRSSSSPRDDGDERMLSMEELKAEMFRSLRDAGTVDSIRAQLRRRFIERLRAHGHRATAMTDSAAEPSRDDATRRCWSVEQQMLHGLFYQYLQALEMEHTQAVFVPEIGGLQDVLSPETILQMLKLSGDGGFSADATPSQPLVLQLLRAWQRRAAVSTRAMATQTSMHCQDHRVALEHELRRVETAFLSPPTEAPTATFEQRVLQYQREYDALCETRLQDEMERFRSTELALLRVQERQRHERELEALQSAMGHEHRERLQRLQDRERELELALAAKRTELEASAFEARQQLFLEIERLRSREAELQAQQRRDERHVAAETQRLALWDEQLRTREHNLEARVEALIQEKEAALALERSRWQAEARRRDEELAARATALDVEREALQAMREETHRWRAELTRLEALVQTLEATHADTQRDLEASRRESATLRHKLEAREALLQEDQLGRQRLAQDNARLEAEIAALQAERTKLEGRLDAAETRIQQADSDARELQQQLMDAKLSMTTAVVEERTKFLALLEDERRAAQWREQELETRARELQRRVAETEATADKFQAQFEDERVHVASLRHEVSSLNALLAQAQATIHAKHGKPAAAAPTTAASWSSVQESAMLARVMEMLATMSAATRPPPAPMVSAPSAASMHQQERERDAEKGDAYVRRQLGVDQQDEELRRRERELEERERQQLERETEEREQREQRARAQREEDERQWRLRREAAEKEEDERRRRQRVEEESELMEMTRRRREAEDRERAELERQRREAQEALEAQRRALDEQIAAEQRRLQEERALAAKQREMDEERRREEQARMDAEREALRRAQEDAQRQEEARRREHEEEEAKQRAAAQRESHLETNAAALQADKAVGEASGATREEATGNGDALELEQELELEPEASPRDEEPGPRDAGGDVSVETLLDGNPPDAVATPSDATPEEQAVDSVEGTQRDPPAAASGAVDAAVAAEAAPAQDESTAVHERAPKTHEELEEERRREAAAAKQREDDAVIDVYRQRVLARKAAERQRQLEREAEEEAARRRQQEAEAERLREQQQQQQPSGEEDDDGLELSGGSFAESSAASDSNDSF